MLGIPEAVAKVANAFDSVLDKIWPDAAERQKHALELAQLAFKEIELANADRDSARRRHAEVKDQTPANLAYIAIGAFVFLAVYIVVFGVPDSSKEIVIGLIAWIAGFVSAAYSFYFGSSHKPSSTTSVEVTKQ
jgi:hypothetical protein